MLNTEANSIRSFFPTSIVTKNLSGFCQKKKKQTTKPKTNKLCTSPLPFKVKAALLFTQGGGEEFKHESPLYPALLHFSSSKDFHTALSRQPVCGI